MFRRLVCRLLGHRWQIHTVTSQGTLTTIPRCDRCERIDPARITQHVWNRSRRRQARRAVERAARRG